MSRKPPTARRNSIDASYLGLVNRGYLQNLRICRESLETTAINNGKKQNRIGPRPGTLRSQGEGVRNSWWSLVISAPIWPGASSNARMIGGILGKNTLGGDRKLPDKQALVAKKDMEEGKEDKSWIQLTVSRFTHSEKGISCWPVVNATTRRIF